MELLLTTTTRKQSRSGATPSTLEFRRELGLGGQVIKIKFYVGTESANLWRLYP